MKTPKSQRGITAVGMLALFALIGFVLMLVIKIIPSYLDQFKVSAALNNLVTDSRAKDASEKEIISLILKKLQVDDVDYLKKENIFIKTTKGNMNVRIQYEHRVPMLSNIDAVVMFDENIDLPRGD